MFNAFVSKQYKHISAGRYLKAQIFETNHFNLKFFSLI